MNTPASVALLLVIFALPVGVHQAGSVDVDYLHTRFSEADNRDSGAFRFHNGTFTQYAKAHGMAGDFVIAVVPGRDGSLWFATDTRLSRLRGGQIRTFTTADGLSANRIGRVVEDRAGVICVGTRQGVDRLVGDRFEHVSRLPRVGAWAKRSIYLTALTIGRDRQPVADDIVLAPGANHVEIDFAAIELTSPEKIRMQYRLDDVDSEWLDAPPIPRAIYSRIPVRTHVLRIRSSNRNGIWDGQGVAFSVTQQPFFYQTRWFAAVTFGTMLLLMVILYRVRVAQISRQLDVRFNARLAERTQVARDIHDTLLQTVQGSRMVADHALQNAGDHSGMVRAMEQLAAWLARATQEGRAALNSLRATTEQNDLGQALRRAIDECRSVSTAEMLLTVEGTSRELHPLVGEEIYRIAHEGLRNACLHSGCTRLDVLLRYANDLTVRITDNGAGMQAATAKDGRQGHFGLRGMRERADSIGAAFALVSSPDLGTVLTLIVPGRTAFRSACRH